MEVFVMSRRRPGGAVLDRDIHEIAEHALDAARDVRKHAGPALHHSAESLSRALEAAAAQFAIAAERFAEGGEQRASGATHAARARLADASERFAQSIRPKKKHHRVRNLLVAGAAIGGIVALVQSPLRAKLTARLFGPPPDEEPPSITLPNEQPRESDIKSRDAVGSPAPSATSEGDGVASGSSVRVDTPQG
jgi:hypothetical protein